MVDLQVTYLEMTEPPRGPAQRVQPDGLSIKAERLDVDSYLALYRAVGDAVQWDSRLRMERTDLERLLSHEAMLLVILRDGEAAAGLCEFVGVGSLDIELAHFGIVPNLYGRGLGAALLTRALQLCWQFSPTRIWLHTDTNDHPGALALYERAGFRRYKQVVEAFPD